MDQTEIDQLKTVLQDVLKQAKALGADAADALMATGQSTSVAWRGKKIESLEHSEGGDLGVRVLFGHRQAVAATSDLSPQALKETVERVVSMAKAAPEDDLCGIANPDEIARNIPALEMADDFSCDTEAMVAHAREAEEAALAVQGVTMCDHTYAGAGRSLVALAASNGFCEGYVRTNYYISAGVLAGTGTTMVQDSYYENPVFQSDLPSPQKVGQIAGDRAVKALGARKMPPSKTSVVFAPRVGRELLGAFVSAIEGDEIARGTSFLKDKMGAAVFNPAITIIDDPFRPRGARSKPFDGECIAPQRRNIVEKGVLQTWLLDLRSARKLGLKSTGHASRGATGIPHPSPTNLYIEAGTLPPEELIKDIQSGFYVTELMGDGVNEVTGDLSQAARGFWIENGVIAFPVHEMTVAGNLKDIFQNMSVASDLEFRYGLNVPTIRVEGMVVA